MKSSMNTAAELLERARIATGLDNYGEESFLEGLERLLAALAGEARLNERGRQRADAQILDHLSWRLRIEHWYAMHPEIDDGEIVAPLIGLGLPRTGSTALSCMLAEDPAVRSLRTWESNAPCPPPEAATQHSDPRIAEQERRQAATDTLAPRLRAMLPVSATAPSEGQNLMAYDFKSMIFQAMFRVPSYYSWLINEADLVPTYRYVKRVLKLLQWHCPPSRWQLKSPSHIAFIDALDAVFPDARYWMTHRNVSEVIPSNVDLHHELSKAMTDELDPGYHVLVNLVWTAAGLERTMAFRANGQDHRFFDVDFHEFQRDPMAIIERLYAFIDEPLTDVARRNMLAWRADMPAGKHGRHDYEAEALGIDLAQLRGRFDFYRPYGAN